MIYDIMKYPTQAFINGEWVDSKSSKTFDVVNPATQELIAKVTECDISDARTAIEASSAAFQSYKQVLPAKRAELLRKWHQLVNESADIIAEIITKENGKPLAEAKGEVAYANSFLLWYAEEATRIYGETVRPSNPHNRIFTFKQPVGPCGILTPWNFPAAMITRKLGAALAAGCTAVIKPAQDTPLTALILVELAHKAGFPPGVLNVVPTDKNTAAIGQEFCENRLLKKVSFTGSTRVGSLLMKQSANSLKKLSFELGGNAPFIVFDDADLDTAIQSVMSCKFRHTGQTCVCANRIYVHRKIYEEFVEKFLVQVKKCKLGNGMNSDVTHGPLISPRAVEKVQSHVGDAIRQGAKILYGGKPLPELGPAFYSLTVLTDAHAGMLCSQEETFGPVAALSLFDTEEEVIEKANSVDVGLASYIFTNNIGRLYRMAEALETGMIGANTGIISDAVLPFGGVKGSGFGREGSKYGIDEYLVIKAVTVAIQ